MSIKIVGHPSLSSDLYVNMSQVIQEIGIDGYGEYTIYKIAKIAKIFYCERFALYSTLISTSIMAKNVLT